MRIGIRVSLMRVDLPLPLTPLMPMNIPSGKSTSRFLRLLPLAPFRPSVRPLPLRLADGTGIDSLPLR